MKFTYFRLLLLLFIGISKTTFGQLTLAPGYIINTVGDTLPGQLEYVNTNLSAKRAFVSNTSGQLEFLKPEQIKQFYVDPEIHFRTLPFKGKKVLMQVISEGRLNLYEYKGHLFLLSPKDSLIMLDGGQKTVEQNGKKHAIYDFNYKSQLRKALPDQTYDSGIEKLPFRKKQISQLAKEINGQRNGSVAKPALKKQHQFEFRAGFTFSNTILTYIPYQQDSLYKPETFFQDVDVEYMPDEKQKLGNFTVGLLYKKKVSRKYSYFKTGILYNKALKTQRTHQPTTHKVYVPINGNLTRRDTVGYSYDAYTYDLSNLEIPVSYYAELTDGRIRPFIELGLTAKIYHMAQVSLKRDIHSKTSFLRTETAEMKLPGYTINPMVGVGGRYILNEKHALIAGLHFDYYRSKQKPEHINFRKASNMNVYVGFGF